MPDPEPRQEALERDQLSEIDRAIARLIRIERAMPLALCEGRAHDQAVWRRAFFQAFRMTGVGDFHDGPELYWERYEDRLIVEPNARGGRQ